MAEEIKKNNPTRGIKEIERNPLENLLNQIIQNTFNPIEEMIKEQNTYKEMKEAGLPLAGKSEQDNINVLNKLDYVICAPGELLPYKKFTVPQVHLNLNLTSEKTNKKNQC